jgi:hypothetical protein
MFRARRGDRQISSSPMRSGREFRIGLWDTSRGGTIGIDRCERASQIKLTEDPQGATSGKGQLQRYLYN